MNKKEKEQVLEILERLTKLETTLVLELRHIKEELRDLNGHIGRLNEDYGRLSMKFLDLEKRQSELENSYKVQLRLWKFVAAIFSPIFTYCVIKLIEWVMTL